MANGNTPILLSSNIFTVVLQAVLKNISQHFVNLGRKVLINILSEYVADKIKIIWEKYPFLYRCVNKLLSAFNFLTDKVLSYIENILKKETIKYTILYLYSEYLKIMEGKLSLNVLLIITWFVCNFDDYFQLYYILLFLSIFKYYLENNTWIINTWIINSYPKLYKILLVLNSLIITGLIIYFLDCVVIKVITPFLRYLWHILKMEYYNRSCNKYTDSDLGKNQKPNMEPNEPSIPLKEEKEEREKREKRLEKKRIMERNRRTRMAEEQGRKKRVYENLDDLSPEQKKERVIQQTIRRRIENREKTRERDRAKYKLKREAEGKLYKPRKRKEQTSQPVEQASIQTPRHISGWTAVNN